MISANIVYSNGEVDAFDLITYVRGEGYWQLLCAGGQTVLLPDSSIMKMTLSSPTQGEEE
jgi:hypothetical protein|tara:strand:- start:558 stop:737 length:180 start_codon:yes stop_codon:yes gene_type:complete